jgi:chromosome segregation ATPase
MSLEDQLKAYEKELAEAEAAISKVNQTLADAQTKLQQAMAAKSALQPRQRLVDDIRASQLAIENARKAADKEREEAEKVRDVLFAQLEKQLSKEHRDSVDAAITKVDSEIADLQKKVESLANDLDKAEPDASDAKGKAGLLELETQKIQVQLRQLPAQITTQQGQVARLKEAARAAALSGRAGEAYLLTRELERAIGTLKDVISATKETDLEVSLGGLWPQLETAKQEAAKKADDLEKAKSERTKTEQQLKSKEQGRDAAIQALVAAGPKT